MLVWLHFGIQIKWRSKNHIDFTIFFNIWFYVGVFLSSNLITLNFRMKWRKLIWKNTRDFISRFLFLWQIMLILNTWCLFFLVTLFSFRFELLNLNLIDIYYIYEYLVTKTFIFEICENPFFSYFKLLINILRKYLFCL